jgi:cytochrome b6-f complex iron-sulfur subunit
MTADESTAPATNQPPAQAATPAPKSAAPIAAAKPTPQGPVTRRKFLLQLGWGFFWVFIASWAGSLLRYLFPNVLYEPSTMFKAGRPEEYEIGTVSDKWKKSQRVWVVRNPDGIYALWARCTHLGCTPSWFSTENRFKCPCHGSNFSKAGDVVAGPAPKPLWRCAVSLDPEGALVINKGQLENTVGRREQAPYYLTFKV